jgi:hypothetical protein
MDEPNGIMKAREETGTENSRMKFSTYKLGAIALFQLYQNF